MSKHHAKHVEKKVKGSCKNYYSKFDNMMEEAKKAKFNCDYELAENLLIEVFASDCQLKNKACLELAKVYRDTCKYDKAIWILNVLCNESSLVHEAYYELANIYFIQRKFNEAEECLSKIKNGFNQFLYNEGMGKLNYFKRNYEEAKEYLTKARDIKGYMSAGNSIRMILIDTKLGNYDEALRGIKEMSVTWFKNPSILLEGNIYITQGNLPDALRSYQKLLNTNYKDVALYRIGYIYGLQRRYKEAANVLVRVYSDLLEKDYIDGIEMIDYNKLVYNLVIAYVKSKQYEEAIRIMECENLVQDEIYSFYYKVYSYCCRMANRTPKYHCNSDLLSYSGYQSEYYKKEAAYAHINRRHIEQTEKSGTILSNTNIDEVWDNAINNLKIENRIDFMSFPDVYCFEYPNIGINGEDRLIVVTNPGTDEIITLYPEFKERMYLHTDDNDEDVKDLNSSSEFNEEDIIIKGLVKED